MIDFDIRRAELVECPTSDSRVWFLLNSKICGVHPARFMTTSPLVASFPEEFTTVSLEELQNGAHLDRRVYKDVVPIASSFGVVSAILRQRCPKPDERDAYSWLVDAINNVKIESRPDTSETSETSDGNVSDMTLRLQSIQEENHKLKTDLELAMSKLESLRDEVTSSSTEGSQSTKPKEELDDVWNSLSDVCDRYQVHLASVIADRALKPEVAKTLSDIADRLMEKKEPKEVLEIMLGGSAGKFFQSLHVPDWTLLYFKLQSRIPDQGWQMLLSISKLGRTGRNSDIPVLLNKNQIKAVRKMIFGIVRKALHIRPLPNGAPQGHQVSLSTAVAWAARETRLHHPDQQTLELNLKLDGRPFFGRQQVMIGIVPINVHHASSESSKSVYPIAIANCKENRKNVEALIRDLNAQKNAIKKNGLTVDGRHFQVKFTVTLDYKALIMLLKRKDDDVDGNVDGLCGRGLDTECCVYCKVIRGCACPGVPKGEACAECFLKSKANIGGWKGLRDDLLFLLEEDLCALHCELRNTEQLLSSLGMFAYECGSLKECNAVLANYGPDSMKGRDRVLVKAKPGQESGIERHNIQVVSFSGSTERRFLDNIEDIVTRSLPLHNLKLFFNNKDVAETYLLNQVTFCEEMIQVEVLASLYA